MTDAEKQYAADAKAELSEYRYLLNTTKWYERKQAEIRSQMEKITQTITGMPGGGQTVPAAQRGVEQLEQLADQYSERLAKLNAATACVLKTLDGIKNPTYRELLQKLYIEGMSLKRACYAVDRKGTHYSYDWMKHLHRNALIAYGKERRANNADN